MTLTIPWVATCHYSLKIRTAFLISIRVSTEKGIIFLLCEWQYCFTWISAKYLSSDHIIYNSEAHEPDRMQSLCVTDLIACNVCVLLTWIRRSRTKLFFEVKCCRRVDVFLHQHLVKSLAQRLARLSAAPFLEHGQRLLGRRKVDARRWKAVQECLSSPADTFQEVHSQRSNVSNVAEMAGQIWEYGRSLGQVSTSRTLTCMNIIFKLGHCVRQLKVNN